MAELSVASATMPPTAVETPTTMETTAMKTSAKTGLPARRHSSYGAAMIKATESAGVQTR